MNGDELGRILNEALDRKFKENLQPIEKRLGNVEEGQKETQQRLTKIEQRLTKVERNMATKKDLETVQAGLKGDLKEIKENMATSEELKAVAKTFSEALYRRPWITNGE